MRATQTELGKRVAPAPISYDKLHESCGEPKRLNDGSFMFRCPSHRDRTASLHATYDPITERWVLHCFGGCSFQQVSRMLGAAR